MKLNSLLILASALVIAGCGTAQTDTYVSEESGLNLTKLTDETSTQLPGPGLTNVTKANLPTASFCGNRKCAIFWNADRDLAISPDGEWILCEGNAKSSISKRENLDIFAVRMDGSQLTRLTYHPAHDYCAVWSKDGNSIYFLSNRANKKDKYNIWKMNFAY